MSWRNWVVLAATASLSATSAPGLAQQPAARVCKGPIIRGSEALERTWGASIAQLRAHAAALRDVDPCAEIDLLPQDEHVLVVLRLADGRTAVREAATPLAAIATAEALLTVLPADDALALETKPSPEPVVAPPLVSEPTRPTPPVEAELPRRKLALDVGIGASTRLTAHPAFLGYGLTGYVSVGINDWLVGSWLRWDFQDFPLSVDVPKHFAASSFLLGAFTGRRIALGSRAALDVLVGPNLVVDTMEGEMDLEGNEVGGDIGALSLGGSLRLLVPSAGRPGFFALLGAEMYPGRLDHRTRADPTLPVFPAWAFTLALGTSWRAL